MVIDRFGSVEKVVSASDEDLFLVEGIGSKKAKKVQGAPIPKVSDRLRDKIGFY